MLAKISNKELVSKNGGMIENTALLPPHVKSEGGTTAWRAAFADGLRQGIDNVINATSVYANRKKAD